MSYSSERSRIHDSRSRHSRIRAGFTLLELVIVIAIIAVLASLVAPNMMRHASDAKVQAARSQIELIGLALEAYHLDIDDYPTSEEGLDILRNRPRDEEKARLWRGPYVKREIPMDPWGRRYIYRYPGLSDSTSFELLTLGRDGQAGGTGDNSDLTSWDNGVHAR